MEQKQGNYNAFYILVLLFFMWGFLTSMNDILVPHLKSVFELKNWQAQLIQFFFFLAYFVMSIPAGILIRKIGYKKGIVAGLFLMGLASFLFIPASYIQVYGFFLLALFLLASGITILQVAANPYVAVLGKSETAASRLNLAQGFNSIGHTLAPLFGAWLILQNTEVVDVSTVRMPYALIACVLMILAVSFLFIRLPDIEHEKEQTKKSFNLWEYKHLYLGALAIFFYVGAEISVGSFLIEYFRSDPSIGLDTKTAGSYVAFYWGGAMVGRFLGAISLGENKSLGKMMLVPLIALLVVNVVLMSNDTPLSTAFGFDIMLLVNFLAFYLGRSVSNQQLALFAGINALLILVSMFSGGNIAIWSILGIGLFNSIMWSNIFTLAIDKLGPFTSYGSSILVMMIVGGAVLPLLQGILADIPAIGIKHCFILPVFAYLYLVYYGLVGYKNEEAV